MTMHRLPQDLFCGVSFCDIYACALTCSFRCSEARAIETYRDWYRRTHYPGKYRQEKKRERAAKKVTWKTIDNSFGEAFADLPRDLT